MVEACGRSLMGKPRPRWGSLYTVILLAGVLLVAVHFVASSAAGREIADGVASFLIIGAMALWVRGNRVALLCSGETSKDGEGLRISVVQSPQPLPRRESSLAGIEGN